MTLESQFQAKLVKELKELFPGCFILKNDPELQTGIPDLLILHGKKWAILEVKRSANEEFRPNQEFYLDKFNRMSYANVIFPENKEGVLRELQQALRATR